MDIIKLLNSADYADREIGRTALMHKNEDLFVDYIKYAAPYFILDPIPASAILGIPYYHSIYFTEISIQENFPEQMESILNRNLINSQNYGDFIGGK